MEANKEARRIEAEEEEPAGGSGMDTRKAEGSGSQPD